MAASKILTCGIRNQKSLDLPLYAFEKKKSTISFSRYQLKLVCFEKKND
jgi:hypothetical protein